MAREPDSFAKILVYDIETAPNLGWYYDKWREGNIIKGEADWYMLCFAYKWLGTDTVHTVALPDFDRYSKDPANDRDVVTELHRLFCEADVTVTHNGVSFDNKKANARFLVHRLPPPPPRKEIDTLQVARRQFGFTSNSLADLCRVLGLPAKGDPGKGTWFGCMNGDMRAWARMQKYNAQDVKILEKLYLRLRPWMVNHPNLNAYGDRPASCPRCGHDKLIRRQWKYAGVTRRCQFQCTKCRGYSMGRTIDNLRIKYRSV
jgi:hypothetical protein